MNAKKIIDTINKWEWKIDPTGKRGKYRNNSGFWAKSVYDSNGNIIYYCDINGGSMVSEYDANNNLIYWESFSGSWVKYEYDSFGNLYYTEKSDGFVESIFRDSTGEKICSKVYWLDKTKLK